jgi:hypothetical protein
MNEIIGLDGYEVRARMLPSIVAGLPLLVAVLFCFPSLREFAPSAALTALLVGCATLLTEFTRGRGKIFDRQLRERACGPLLLTWADEEIGPGLKREIRAALAKSLPDFPLLNAQEEKLEANTARTLCAEVISALVPSFRNRRRYPLIHAELISLRFRRNVLSLRPYALASCRIGALLGLICAIFSPEGTAPTVVALLAACICTATAILFEEVITFDWVCAAEKEYVKELLLAVASTARASSYSSRRRE